jgi:antitoxin MazE
MKTAIRRIGNSHGVTIPKPLLAEFGAKPGDAVDMKIERGKIVMMRSKRKPRKGWADASKMLAAAGEGGLVWPEFGNEGDKDWTW